MSKELVEKIWDPGHSFDVVGAPLRWKKPAVGLVEACDDLFREDVTDEVIGAAFGVMAASPQHTFRITTHNAQRLPAWDAWIIDQGEELKSAIDEEPGPATSAPGSACVMLYNHTRPIRNWLKPSVYNQAPWPLPNVWIGVAIERRAHMSRIESLRKFPAAVRFISADPLLDDLGDVDLTAIDWVLIGGEHGSASLPFDIAWARKLLEQCKAQKVPAFVRQLGSKPFDGLQVTGEFRTGPGGRRQFKMTGTKLSLRNRYGRDIAEWPADLRVRDLPKSLQ